jgi:hypothetical protein
VNGETLSEFGDYLLSHSDESPPNGFELSNGTLLQLAWLLWRTELVDHLPELFQNLAAVLKGRKLTRTAAKFLVLRGGMAGIAGAKVTSSTKSYMRPASSGESLSEPG